MPYKLIGMEEMAARKAISSNNFMWQIIERDGCKIPHYKNLRLDRVNLIIDHGIVLNAFIG